MESHPDAVDISLDQLKRDAQTSAARIAARTLVAMIPYAGGPILELWSGVAQRRTEARLGTVFEKMKERLASIDKEKVDKTFFDSEEFQTLLYLLMERLHTTHDDEKLQAFGTALANSGTAEFKEDPKEQYVRTLRDLSLKDLHVLQNFASISRPGVGISGSFLSAILNQANIGDAEKPSLSRLLGVGLMTESIKMQDFNPRVPTIPTSQQSAERYARTLSESFQRYFHQPPIREYALSKFGHRFLDFITSEHRPATDPPSPRGDLPQTADPPL